MSLFEQRKTAVTEKFNEGVDGILGQALEAIPGLEEDQVLKLTVNVTVERHGDELDIDGSAALANNKKYSCKLETTTIGAVDNMPDLFVRNV